MPEQHAQDAKAYPVDVMSQEINDLKQIAYDLQETIECLSIPGHGYFVSQPVGQLGPVEVTKGGGLVGRGKLPGEPLINCQSVRAWRNNTGAAKDRTVTVDPANPPNGFPPGSTVTVFVGTDGGLGNPPPAGPNGPTKQTLGDQGGSESFTVPPGQSIYVHYAKGRTGPAGIRAEITNAP